jgi:hypothetical protein
MDRHGSWYAPTHTRRRDAEGGRDATDRERACLDGKLDLVGKVAVGCDGNALGTVVDVEFDPDSAAVQRLVEADQPFNTSRLLGVGSYAAVISDTQHSS